MMRNDRYRRGVGVMLLNDEGKVFVGARIDNTDEAWQMPQGGIDEDEKPWKTALRELEEETGISPGLVERIAKCPERMKYDLPARASRQALGRQICRAGSELVPRAVPRVGPRHQHRDEASGISRVEMDRAAAASRPDRALQARSLQATATRIRGISLSVRPCGAGQP